jgi:penicillin-binding protein 1C
MAIGNPEVSPEQLATAFAMLANGGVFRPVKYLQGQGSGFRVQGSGVRSQELGVRSKERERRYILLPQTAYIISDILSDPTARALTFNRSRLMMDFPFRVAIKTGTSTFFRDLWAVGYTPDYTVAVWVGNFDGSATKNLSGSSAAVPIFADIMTWLYPQSEPTWFKQPKGLRRVTVCGYSGMKPSLYCDHTLGELFIAGTEPRETCTFHTATAKRHELSAPYAGWLYDKNRIGSAGRFRLAGFGDELNTVFQDPLEGMDQPEPGIHARNIKKTKSVHSAPVPKAPQPANQHYSIDSAAPDQTASIVASGDTAITIVYPLDRDRFVLNGSEKSQQIKLQAVVADPVAYVDWFVNGKLFKRTGPPYQAYWPLEQGRFRITAVTPSNLGDSVAVEIE